MLQLYKYIMKKDFVFIVLHYQTIHETLQTVESLLKIIKPKDQIVIVDNASPNTSLQKLKDHYQNQENISIIHCTKNLGFANGNNAGYYFTKKQFNPEYICILNNDVIVTDPLFIEKCRHAYQRYNYAVMCPKIKLPSGQLQKELGHLLNINSYWQQLCQAQIELFFTRNKLLYPLYNILDRLISKLGLTLEKIHPKALPLNYLHNQLNIIPMGCCLIFSPGFIQQYANAFDQRTFMYGEETLLTNALFNAQATTLYYAETEIIHLGGVSTQHNFKEARRKKIFFLEHFIHYTRLLIADLNTFKHKIEPTVQLNRPFEYSALIKEI